jgi:hypothetical protein
LNEKQLIDFLSKTAVLPILPIDLCTEIIRRLQPNAPIHPTNICTGPLDGSVSPCIADSGSAVVQEVDGEVSKRN